MNLNNLEKHIDPIILERGRGYVDRVHALEETEPEFWQAYVDGTRTYDVEIQLEGKEISDWSWLDKFLLKYQPPALNPIPAKQQYQQLFDNIVRQYASHDFIDYDDAAAFAEDVQELLHTLTTSTLALADKVETCLTLAYSIAGIAEKMDDSNGEINEMLYGVEDILSKIYPELPTTAQTAVFQRLLATQFDEHYTQYGLDETFTSLLQTWAQNNPTYQDAYLQTLDKRLTSRPNDW